MTTSAIKAHRSQQVEPTAEGSVLLGFGPQPMDFFAKAVKVCGKDAIVCPDAARMAGANLAAGTPAALAALRTRLTAGVVEAQKVRTPGLPEAAIHWLAAGERGVSSNTLFSRLTGIDALGRQEPGHPRDPDDFNRCLKLLLAMPELRERLPRMQDESAEWAALVRSWDAIEKSHLDEVGLDWSKGGKATKTYGLIKRVLDEARRTARTHERQEG